MKSKLRLVKITWVDAFSIAEWQTLEEVLENAKSNEWEVTEVGWLLFQCKEYLVVASQFSRAGNWGNITKIPRSWLIKIESLERRKS